MRKLSDVSNYTPKKWQPEAIRNLLKNRYHILADDMGLGKTFEFIANVLILNEKAVIVCPAYLKYVWNNEISKVCKDPEDKKLFVVTSYSKAKDLLDLMKAHEAKIIGFDEAHYLKNMKAKRTINSFEAIAEHEMERIVLMSGTPIKNRIPEWYSLLRLIHWHIGTDFLDKFPTEWSFSIHFCYEKSFVIKGKKGSRRVTTFYGLRKDRRQELLSYVRPCMTRRLAKDVLGLDDPTYFHIEANTSDQYDEDLLEAFKSGKDSTAKRKSALAKVPFTSKFLLDLKDMHKKVDDNGKETPKQIVVFTGHPEVATQLSAKFEDSEVIVGDTPIKNREGIVARFQAGETSILFCTIGAASTGHTMTATNIMVLNDMSHVAGDNDQAVRRVSRLGQKEACLVYCIGGSKVDADINRNLEQKIKDLKQGM